MQETVAERTRRTEGIHRAALAAVLSAADRLESVLRRHGLFLAGSLLVVAGTYGNALFIHPLDADNLYSLSAGHRSDPGAFFTGTAHGALHPFYRPVAELTVWAQYHVLGLQVHSFFFVNILIWVACAWGLYALVYLATRSRVFGAIAALATMLDARGILAILWILERQSALALLLGTCALLLTLYPDRGGRRAVLWSGIFLLLLAAALSKEFGLAFSIAVPLFALLQRVRDRLQIAVAGAASIAAYAFLRLVVAGGAVGHYCDQMGYFRTTRTVCYADYASFDQIKQRLWNVGATFVGIVFPSLFDGFGTLVTPSARSLVVPAVVLAAACVGLVKRPRWSLPLLALVVLNALLDFVLYRTRNQVIGCAALYAAAAIGLEWAVVQQRARLGRFGAVVVVGGAVLVTGWLGWNAVLRPRTVQTFQRVAAASDSCAALRRYPAEISLSVVRALKERYGVKDPGCSGRG